MKIHVFLAILLLPMFSVFPVSAETSQNVYHLGVILPMSGTVASLGQNVQRGIDLAYSELTDDQKSLIQISYQDDQFETTKTLAAYQKLSAIENVNAVFVIGSPPALALAPLTERKKQILIGIGASDFAIVKNRHFAFTHWVTPETLGNTIAKELFRRQFKRIGFVTSEASGTIADRDATVAALKSLNISDRVVYDQTFLREQTDYASAINLMKDKKVDVVVLTLFPGALSSFAKQSKKLNLQAELSGIETFEDENEVTASQGTLINAWYVNGSSPSEDFSKKFLERYKVLPGWAAANGYDALKLLARTVSNKKFDNEEIRESLVSLKDYSGAAGTYSATGDNRFALPAALKQVTATGFRTIEQSGK